VEAWVVEVEAKGGEGERLPTQSGLSKHSRAVVARE